MKTEPYIVTLLLNSVACGQLLLGISTAAEEPIINGIWTWVAPGRNGAPDRTNTLNLKIEGHTVTGKTSTPGRDGKLADTPIAEGKVDGDAISFFVIREVNGNATTNKYWGKFAGDKITGKIEFTRDGQKQFRDWEARRSTEKP
jgi:hypothetical protein